MKAFARDMILAATAGAIVGVIEALPARVWRRGMWAANALLAGIVIGHWSAGAADRARLRADLKWAHDAWAGATP